MDKIIEIKNLSKSFGDKKVLEDINLYIRRGEFITLLGPSGCGKTTLLRMIAGFLQPDEGSILMDGKEEYPLKKGETFYIRGDYEHILRNTGSHTAQILWICTPPMF